MSTPIDQPSDDDLTREEIQGLLDAASWNEYRMADTLAFVAEMLAKRTSPSVWATDVEKWLRYTGTPCGAPPAGPSLDSLIRVLRAADLRVVKEAFQQAFTEGKQP